MRLNTRKENSSFFFSARSGRFKGLLLLNMAAITNFPGSNDITNLIEQQYDLVKAQAVVFLLGSTVHCTFEQE